MMAQTGIFCVKRGAMERHNQPGFVSRTGIDVAVEEPMKDRTQHTRIAALQLCFYYVMRPLVQQLRERREHLYFIQSSGARALSQMLENARRITDATSLERFQGLLAKSADIPNEERYRHR